MTDKEKTILDKKGIQLTQNHLLAIQKLAPGAEWTFNGTDLIWYSKDILMPSIEDIETAIPKAVQEYQDEQIKEELIQEKIRELAIEALKKEGKLGTDGKLIKDKE